MKKVFYITTKKINDWDFLVPPNTKNPMQTDISILLLQDGVGQENLPSFPVYVLNSGDEKGDSTVSNMMSYQEFLEQIFFNDLPLVI